MIPGVTPVPKNTTSGLNIETDNSLGKDDFLKLLIAQLSAQDPLDPMGAHDFSAQLAQFSGLEQMTNVNINLEKLQQQQAISQNTAVINLIGKTVESSGNTFNHVAGASKVLSYSLGGDAESIRMGIFDREGNQVDMVKLGSQGEGKNQVSWDGLDNQGNPLAAGTYSFVVTASNYAGQAVSVTTFSSGLVSDVVFGEGENYVIVNGKELPISAIKRVSINQ